MQKKKTLQAEIIDTPQFKIFSKKSKKVGKVIDDINEKEMPIKDNPFEKMIKKEKGTDNQIVRARDFFKFMELKDWQSFEGSLFQKVDNDQIRVCPKSVKTGKGLKTHRNVTDFKLSLQACYDLVLNGRSDKAKDTKKFLAFRMSKARIVQENKEEIISNKKKKEKLPVLVGSKKFRQPLVDKYNVDNDYGIIQAIDNEVVKVKVKVDALDTKFEGKYNELVALLSEQKESKEIENPELKKKVLAIEEFETKELFTKTKEEVRMLIKELFRKTLKDGKIAFDWGRAKSAVNEIRFQDSTKPSNGILPNFGKSCQKEIIEWKKRLLKIKKGRL